MAPFRVLVVDDSVFMRKIVSDLIVEDERFAVIDTAKNGQEAIEKIKLLRPDVVTMDVEMPIMNGLEALQKIMAEQPTPILMLSSLTGEGAAETIRALEYGAVDFICKPSGSISLDLYKVKSQLHEKLQIAVRTKFKSSLARMPDLPEKAAIMRVPKVPAIQSNSASTVFEHVVAIGTSTGGPRALHEVLTHIPAFYPAPILIVQHMPPNFTKSLAQRLDNVCPIRVVEATHGEIVEAGTAYIAPGGWHMRLRKHAAHTYRIELSKEDPRTGHRPSVDVLFESLVTVKELKRHAVLMTGMGSDGAKGMLALLKSGAQTTIAEAEDTCVVYGMPRTAVMLHAASCVLPQYQIAQKLIEIVQSDPITS
ncbi:chemotaxis response regulator protein-glutamate methylesterase [Paenibacillus sp. N1-5-1-14]|uniref:protein-glutamate methylesterase/protein-glutamine glutaminase n=1 Tax=Paenibacillus radicibacter TaxID=2972488 RepID=UPI0021599298|nr:chemotaxis response regulator protein-glutamate methylesterase [Paenibacillus radicibacter]MCR8642172.1 chemotaxis response regulator protein-glutamate methylesterase [Paenibacillus radicibacter]